MYATFNAGGIFWLDSGLVSRRSVIFCTNCAPQTLFLSLIEEHKFNFFLAQFLV